jgi:hypothetical protein
MSVRKLTNNPEIFITEAALDHTRRFISTGDTSKERRYTAVIEWCERSRYLSNEFTGDLIELKQQFTEKALAVELKRRADAHAKPLPPHISLGAVEPWKCPKDDIITILGSDIRIRKDTFREALIHGNVIDLSDETKILLRKI